MGDIEGLDDDQNYQLDERFKTVNKLQTETYNVHGDNSQEESAQDVPVGDENKKSFFRVFATEPVLENDDEDENENPANMSGAPGSVTGIEIIVREKPHNATTTNREKEASSLRINEDKSILNETDPDLDIEIVRNLNSVDNADNEQDSEVFSTRHLSSPENSDQVVNDQ